MNTSFSLEEQLQYAAASAVCSSDDGSSNPASALRLASHDLAQAKRVLLPSISSSARHPRSESDGQALLKPNLAWALRTSVAGLLIVTCMLGAAHWATSAPQQAQTQPQHPPSLWHPSSASHLYAPAHSAFSLARPSPSVLASAASRKLLCEPYAPDDTLPSGLEALSEHQLYQGGVLLHVVFLCYLLLGWALLWQYSVLPSVQFTAHTFGLLENKGAATLLALCGCMPTFFSNFFCALYTHRDLGTGIILGAGMTNTLAAPWVLLLALGGLGVGFPVFWWRATRDLLASAVATLVLVTMLIIGSRVSIGESIILLLLGCVYGAVLYNDTKLYRALSSALYSARKKRARARKRGKEPTRLQRFLENAYFSHFITLCILVSLVSLIWQAVDDSGDTAWLTSVGYAITGIFILEAVLTGYAFGALAYWSSPHHALDGVLVILMLFELTFGSGSLAASVRAVRMFRFLRALRSLRAVRAVRIVKKQTPAELQVQPFNEGIEGGPQDVESDQPITDGIGTGTGASDQLPPPAASTEEDATAAASGASRTAWTFDSAVKQSGDAYVQTGPVPPPSESDSVGSPSAAVSAHVAAGTVASPAEGGDVSKLDDKAAQPTSPVTVLQESAAGFMSPEEAAKAHQQQTQDGKPSAPRIPSVMSTTLAPSSTNSAHLGLATRPRVNSASGTSHTGTGMMSLTQWQTALPGTASTASTASSAASTAAVLVRPALVIHRIDESTGDASADDVVELDDGNLGATADELLLQAINDEDDEDDEGYDAEEGEEEEDEEDHWEEQLADEHGMGAHGQTGEAILDSNGAPTGLIRVFVRGVEARRWSALGSAWTEYHRRLIGQVMAGIMAGMALLIIIVNVVNVAQGGEVDG